MCIRDRCFRCLHVRTNTRLFSCPAVNPLYLRVVCSPSVSYTHLSYITTLEHGAEVEVLQEGDPWVKVIYNSEKKREGYVKLAYLTYEKGVMQSKEDADLIVGTTPVYTAPDTESETLFQLPDSMSVKILDDSDEKFNLIETNGKQGLSLIHI